MISFIKKDITTVTTGVIAHGVNCVGVMGSGVALSIRNKWNNVFTEYVDLVKKYNNPSELLGVSQVVQVEQNELYVLNGFTQVSFGSDSKTYANVQAVEQVISSGLAYAEYKNLPFYMPKIGCLRGGLSWEVDINPILVQLSNDHPTVEIFVCDL